MTFLSRPAIARWLGGLLTSRTPIKRRYPDADEPPHQGWTGHSLAIEAALTTGLDGSTGALVALWPSGGRR
jgi:hypothetical protein